MTETTAPWDSVPDDPFFVRSAIPGMISPEERKMLFWAARDHWVGVGEIVEIGSFAGLSTSYLAEGVKRNTQCPYKSGRVHAYDLFQIDESNAASYLPFLPQLGPDYRGSFLQVFEQNVRAYRDIVSVHPGDTYEVAWSGRPIEVLFVDCSISAHFHEMVFHKFYRSLMATKGLLIHQDFFFHRSFYLAPMMRKLADYFEPIANADTSMVYGCIRPLDDALFRRPLISGEQELLHILREEIEHFGGMSSPTGGVLATTLVFYYASHGRLEAARQLAAEIEGKNCHEAVLGNLRGALAG